MPILEATKLHKQFKDKEGTVDAVKDLSLTLEPGEVLGFLGPNGAGKTTTIKMIAGLVEPTSGQVRVLGKDPQKDRRALHNLGAVLEGNRNVYWRLTAIENLQYFGVLKGLSMAEAKKRGMALLELLDLDHKADVPLRKFSRGMQQKVALAASLIHDPDMLLLDEPTLGLDAVTTQRVKDLVREKAAQGKGIILTTHQLGIAEELSGRLAIIRDGSLITSGRTEDLLEAFSGKSYKIRLNAELDSDRKEKITRAGCWFEEDGVIGFQGEDKTLYEILDILKPLSLDEVSRDRANLQGIFLKLVGEDN